MVKFFRRLCSCFGPSPSEADLPSPDHSSPAATLDSAGAKAPQLVSERHTVAIDEIQRHPAAEAHNSGRLAISFSGGGFLLPYFIGVADALLQLGVLRIGATAATATASTGPAAAAKASAGPTPLAGSSAGSLVAVSLACGLTPARILDSFLDSVQDCRTNGSYRRLEEVLYRQLEATLPPDAAERCAGVATVSVTRLFPKPRTQRISSFSSRADLIAALMASCHIPTYFNGDVTTTFRGVRSVDGGVTAIMPVPTTPHDFLLKVCCFPRQQLARLPIFNRRRALHGLKLGISPGAFGPWPYSFRYMLAAALHPRSDRFIRMLLEAGCRDGTSWALAAGIATEADLQRMKPLPLPPHLEQQPPLSLAALEPQPSMARQPSVAQRHQAAAEAAAAAVAEAATATLDPTNGGDDGAPERQGGEHGEEAVVAAEAAAGEDEGVGEGEEVEDEEAGPGLVAAAAALPALAGLVAAEAAADAATAAAATGPPFAGREGSRVGGAPRDAVAVEPGRA